MLINITCVINKVDDKDIFKKIFLELDTIESEVIVMITMYMFYDTAYQFIVNVIINKASMQIIIQSLNFGQMVLEVHPSDSLYSVGKSLRARIEDMHQGLDIEVPLALEKVLTFEGIRLNEDLKLSEDRKH